VDRRGCKLNWATSRSGWPGLTGSRRAWQREGGLDRTGSRRLESKQEWLHCPKTSERNFNLGVLNLYEIHFMALLSVKYPYPVSNVLLHRI